MQRFGAVPVTGIPPHHAMYKADTGISVPTGQLRRHPLVDLHPVSSLYFTISTEKNLNSNPKNYIIKNLNSCPKENGLKISYNMDYF